MFRLLALSAAALLLAAPVSFADDERKPDEKKPDAKASKIDKTKLFGTMDADGDGKVTRDEFTKGMEKMLEKVKDKAADKGGKAGNLLEKLGGQVGGKLFDKLDADSDGKLTKEEFEKAEFGSGKLREMLGKRKDK
jgi:Ca2+-binding EF-hand superfamily protein